MGKPNKSTESRLRSLDALRGIAVLMVLFVHAPWPISLGEGVAGRLLRIGSYGVDLFFVLSGFLISGLLFSEYEKTGRLDVVRFWLRRGFKIWPSYYVAYGSVFLATCILQWKGGNAIGAYVAGSLPNFFFLQNYVGYQFMWPASWSLAVEEHFYTVLPLVMILLLRLRKGFRDLPWICAAICIFAPLVRSLGRDHDLVYAQTHYRADGLCYGVILGYLYCYYPRVFERVVPWWPALLLMPVVALAIPYAHSFDEWYMRVPGLTALSLSFFGLVALAIARPNYGQNIPVGIRRALDWLAWLGVYSYTVYLCQAVAFFALPIAETLLNRLAVRLVGTELHVGVPLFFLVSVGGGIVLSHLVERPFLSLRQRLMPRRSAERIGSIEHSEHLAEPVAVGATATIQS